MATRVFSPRLITIVLWGPCVIIGFSYIALTNVTLRMEENEYIEKDTFLFPTPSLFEYLLRY